MSRLFYHVMQDNAGNLLFDVSGTMRIAGSGALATIYGDEALTIPIANPMTNHPSFGSFKCFLGAGDYDFYMAKSGYVFETLTGVQGHGTMAQQDASAVAITGGSAILTSLNVTGTAGPQNVTARGVIVPDYTPASGTPAAFYGGVSPGTNRYNLFMDGLAANFVRGPLHLGAPGPATYLNYLAFDKTAAHGLGIQQLGNDAAGNSSIAFLNVAGSVAGYIIANATTVTYATSSDARLKHAVTALTGELDVVKALRPVRFLWNADDSPGVGFLAHEVAAHVAGVVSGEPDAVNEDGSVRAQMIDYSKLVPWLVGACQTLAAHVESLTARLQVLEDALGV